MTNVNPDNAGTNPGTAPRGDASRSGGAHAVTEQPAGPAALPLRGLAMVLIAVAVVLGLWAIYAATKDSDSDVNSAPAAPAASSQAPGQSGSGATATGGHEGGAAPSPAQASQPASAPAGQPGASDGAQAPAAAAPEAGAGAGAAADAPKRISVLNNSTTKGLAADISNKMKADGYQLGEVGNFNEEILPETTVFYPKGDAAAEAEARKIASDIKGIARENIDSLPKKATDDRGLTIVLTNPQ